MRRLPRLLVLIVVCCVPAVAFATTYDTRPKQAVLFRDTTRFIAQDGWNSLALYRTSDATLIRRFSIPDGVEAWATSPDERVLLTADVKGGLRLWKIESGEEVWQKPASETLLSTYTLDVSFSGNGERFAACDMRDSAIVFDTPTGNRVQIVSFRPGLTSVQGCVWWASQQRFASIGDG